MISPPPPQLSSTTGYAQERTLEPPLHIQALSTTEKHPENESYSVEASQSSQQSY